MEGATKIPDPTLDAATNIAVSMSNIAFADPLSDCGVASVETAELLMQGMEKAKVASSANVGGVSWGNLQNVGGGDDCR